MKIDNAHEEHKYTSLIVSIALFLLIIIGLFVLSNIASRQGQANNERVNVAAVMRDSIQTINRDVFMLSYYRQHNTDNADDQTIVDEIGSVSAFLQTALTAFKQGGDVVLPDETVDVSAAEDEEIVVALNNAMANWHQLYPLLKDFIANSNNPAKLNTLVESVESTGMALYEELDEIAELVHEQTHGRAAFLETIQTVGIGVAIVYFVIFIFFIVRRLKRGDLQLAEARKETTEIMQTIEEGLFLIDENLHIGQQTSDKLAQIIPGHTFHNQDMETVLQDIVGSDELDDTRRFVKQLFNKRIDEKLIQDLNPLQRVVIRIEHEDDIELRYVRFIFNRVWEKEIIQHILVTVNDITDAVRLEHRLEKERAENEQYVELLMKVLQISPPLLASFLRNATHLTERVNEILRRRGHSITDLKSKAKEIFRDIHGFKGESSALGLDRFVEDCEIIEDCLKTVQQKTKVSGDDFMPVTIALNDLIERIHIIENMRINIAQMSPKVDETKQIKDEIEQYYKRFAREVAQRNGKKVALEIPNYEMDGMSEEKHDQFKEIIVQFIRNAVVHGIELPTVRTSLDKSPEGHLTLTLQHENDHYIVSFSDDGAGLNAATLREKAKQLPQYADHPELVDHMTAKELVRLIFTSGFSTAKQDNQDAGRGVGMDVVKDRIRALGGRIALKSKSERGTTFTVQVPQ